MVQVQKLRLHDDLVLNVLHSDETEFGSAVTGLCDALVRSTCRPLFESAQLLSSESTRRLAPRRLAECFGARALGQLYRQPGVLRETCLYPNPDGVRPRYLTLTLDGRTESLSLEPSLWQELAAWIGDWSRPTARPRYAPAARLWDALLAMGALIQSEPLQPLCEPGLTFVGHATVAFRRGDTRVVFDPYFLPSSDPAYRQIRPTEIAPDAVFITHSHPDHYDLGSLLRFGRDVPIYVPVVLRESLLSVDMATRLRQLGFTRVMQVSWGSAVNVGALRIDVMPFYGEQPTHAERFHPEVRNEGNTYFVDDGHDTFAVLADAGADEAGQTVRMAREMLQANRRADVVIGGYRAWNISPAQLLRSSVARYLLFVPPELWGQRFKLMNDADDLVETAATWRAHTVVPYANGGAPWYWDIGLGPRLFSEDHENESTTDPDVATVHAAARRIPRALRPRIVSLHPGERLTEHPRSVGRYSLPDLRWPYPGETTSSFSEGFRP